MLEKIVLASSSPRREQLLKQIGLSFTIISSTVEENISLLRGNPESKAEQLALAKAQDVAKGLTNNIVIGADTIVVIDDEILGKPGNNGEAHAMLSKLSGREHKVITGIAVIDLEYNVQLVEHETTIVRFRELTDQMIYSYIDSGEPEGKAGAYAVQGLGAIFVEKIEGCYSNVVGLPLSRLSKMLEEVRVKIL